MDQETEQHDRRSRIGFCTAASGLLLVLLCVLIFTSPAAMKSSPHRQSSSGSTCHILNTTLTLLPSCNKTWVQFFIEETQSILCMHETNGTECGSGAGSSSDDCYPLIFEDHSWETSPENVTNLPCTINLTTNLAFILLDSDSSNGNDGGSHWNYIVAIGILIVVVCSILCLVMCTYMFCSISRRTHHLFNSLSEYGPFSSALDSFSATKPRNRTEEWEQVEEMELAERAVVGDDSPESDDEDTV